MAIRLIDIETHARAAEVFPSVKYHTARTNEKPIAAPSQILRMLLVRFGTTNYSLSNLLDCEVSQSLEPFAFKAGDPSYLF